MKLQLQEINGTYIINEIDKVLVEQFEGVEKMCVGHLTRTLDELMDLTDIVYIFTNEFSYKPLNPESDK